VSSSAGRPPGRRGGWLWAPGLHLDSVGGGRFLGVRAWSVLVVVGGSGTSLTGSGVQRPQPLDEVARGGDSHSGGVEQASPRRGSPCGWECGL
jgi:hypothetical protein